MTDAEGPAGGRYRLGPVLRTDGRSVTYRATDAVLRREVVAKLSDLPAALDARLHREYAAARRTSALAHHNLVPLLDVELGQPADGGRRLLLVREYTGAPTVSEYLAEHGPMTARQVAFAGFDIAEALEYLHARGVVARGSIAADGVLLADEVEGRRQARIADLSDSAEPGGEGDALPADDVRRLGLLLIRMLAGTAAMEAPEGTPPRLAELIAAMTAASPAARPDATKLAVALREVIAHEFGRHRLAQPAQGREPDEEQRLAALRRYDLLDTPPEGAFDRITAIAARTFGVPVSTVSIVDRDRIWFKSRHGMDAEQVDRDPGLCSRVVETGQRIQVPDGRADPESGGNPLMAGEAGLRFYAGVPLASAEGYVLGALSIGDYRPRELSEQQFDLLEDLGTLVTHELEMRLAARRAVLSRE